MKGNKIDELFRSKLDQHKTEAPIGAWDKIEAGLPQKKKKGAYFWLSIAASICLIAVTSWVLLSPPDASQKATELAEKQQKITPKEIQKETPTSQEDVKPTEEQIELISPKFEEPVQLVAQENNNSITNEQKEEVAIEVPENFQVNIDLIEPEALRANLRQTRTPRVLEVAIDMQSLIQTSVLSRAEFEQSQKTKNKGFGLLDGIVAVAKGVNSGAKALSEIRQSKNEFVSSDLNYGAEEEDIEDSPQQEK